MPPSNCLASSSRNSQSSRIFKNAFTPEGLNRFSTSLLERSAGFSQEIPAVSRLIVATLPPASPYMEYYASIIGYKQSLQCNAQSRRRTCAILRKIHSMTFVAAQDDQTC